MSGTWRDNNDLHLLINGEEYFPRVFAAMSQARHEILLETFIIFADPVGNELKAVLLEAVGRGVRVEVTVDGFGSEGLPPEYVSELVQAGVKLRMFDPKPRRLGMRTNIFRRLHRKIVVVDGELAFVGGINFAEEHLVRSGPMAKQDYAVEIRGPAVRDVHRASTELLAQFAEAEWLPTRPPGNPDTATGTACVALAVRDNGEHRTDIEQQYLEAIGRARRKIILAHAYFFPSYRLLRALRQAACRGVEVLLILQGRPDQPWTRMFSTLLYNYLLRDGVKIYEYCQRPLHGKVAVVDEEWVTVGSSNLDPLSLWLNLEANLIIRHPPLNMQLSQHLYSLAKSQCQSVTLANTTPGYLWRAPLIFLCFHLLRYFPAIAGFLPAHTPTLKPLEADQVDGQTIHHSEERP